MSTLHICRGPELETVVDKPNGEQRWCFTCRQRVEFRFVVEAPKEPSYWGALPSIQCVNGHTDGDLFPGRVREWDE